MLITTGKGSLKLVGLYGYMVMVHLHLYIKSIKIRWANVLKFTEHIQFSQKMDTADLNYHKTWPQAAPRTNSTCLA